MYYLIQHAAIRWPEKAKHGIEVSEDAKDLVEKVTFPTKNKSHFIVVIEGQKAKTGCERRLLGSYISSFL